MNVTVGLTMFLCLLFSGWWAHLSFRAMSLRSGLGLFYAVLASLCALLCIGMAIKLSQVL